MPKKPTRKVRKWKTSNGNVCFQFPMRETFERPWIIILAAFLVIIICCVEFWGWNSYTLLTPSMVLFFIFFLWWINIPVKNNEIIVVKTIHEIMDNIVNEDAKAVRRTVIRTLVNHDTKGTYGIVEASCLLVLLDNGEVWEYPIIYHKHNNQDTYFECERAHIVSNNQNHIHRINPQKWKRFINRLKLSEKTCLGLLLTTILVVGFLILVGFYWIMKNYIWQSLLIFVGYLFLYSLIGWIYLKWPVKILNAIRFSMSIPLEILIFLFRAISPFFTIVGTYLFVALFTFGVPAIILTGLSRLEWIVLRPETITFIIFTIGSILCSNSYRSTKWIIHQTPLKDWGNHRYEAYREKLAIYLIHPSNVIYLLYLIYFIFLGVSGFLQIEDGSYLISKDFDAAILKAFLVFMAFANMRTKSREAKADIKELLQQTLKLFVHDK